MGFIRTLIRSFTVHHTLLAAAGVAYYCALAVVPLLIGVVSVYGVAASPEDVASDVRPLADALPPEAADLLVSQLEGVAGVPLTGSVVGLAVSAFGLLWLISNAFNALVMSIRLAHERPSPHNWVQGRVFALGLSLAAVVALALLLLILIGVPSLASEAGFDSAVRRIIWIVRIPLVLAVGTAVQSMLYRLVLGSGPSGVRRYIGSFLGTVVWVAGTMLMSLSLSNVERIESTFGSIGSVAVLMLWLYLSVAAVLFGAEVDGVLARGRGRSPTSAFITGEQPTIDTTQTW